MQQRQYEHGLATCPYPSCHGAISSSQHLHQRSAGAVALVAASAAVTILFLGSALFLITSFRAMSPFPGSLSYAYHHYLLILGPLTFTVRAL